MSQESQLTSSSLNPSTNPLSETDSGFAFTTERGTTYRLGFSSDSNYLPDTSFADSVFSFSLLPVSGSFDRKDPRTKPTIIQALNVFFDTNSKAVILYIHSTENDQERIRSRLFNQWFSKHQDGFEKYDFNYPEQRLYMSAIVRQDLPERWRVELMILRAIEENK